MREITEINEIQAISLNILKFLKDICENNGLKYYIAYGTLIGAIRHHGFIPWDDDIDVLMPRNDYYKLIEILKTVSHSYYKLISFETEKNFTAPLPKIIDTRTLLIQKYGYIEKIALGVYIDIFILDGVGNTYDEAIKYYKWGDLLLKHWERADKMLFLPNSNNRIKDILRWIRNSPDKVMGISYYLKKLKEHCEKKDYNSSKYVSTMSLRSVNKPKKNVLLKSDFGKGIKVEFEDCLFNAPDNYEKLLKTWYEDYMEIPPIEKRVSDHKYNAYWKD